VKRIKNVILSRRNLTLVSLRRMGKKGLMKHIRYQLEQSKKPGAVICIDIRKLHIKA